MTQAALLLAVLLAAPAPTAPEPPSSPAAAARAPTLVVRARGLDERALAGALRPRSGGADVVLLRDVASVDPDHTFVDVELQAAELTVTIIVRDGRVFVRRGPGGGPRDAARLCASMLAAIADDALAPLPERATSPALAAGPSEQVPEDMPESPSDDVPLAVPVPPAPEPEPAVPPNPVPQDMLPRSDPLAVVEPAPARPPPVPAPKAMRPTVEFALSGGPLFGLGVPDADVRGGGGEVRVDLRGPRAWLVTAGVRAAGHVVGRTGPASREEQFGLARVRVSVGAGTWLRRGRFELRATANLAVEPWLVTHANQRVRPGESVDPAPLLGGHIRIAPTFAVTRRLHLGAFAEVAASATPTGNAVRVRLSQSRLFTMGGLEASLGIELRVDPWAKRPKQRQD
ncbi:hypothetical protein [Nannocystis radixulma]|uniref:Uncharacterized protein n=1 Tax=Nannocystis radixulma TaxID=2995305 RepID=A0ABT5AYM5_9BACT|nr:hypothetical protein [Nannocystis radixulma]MDC0666588.1 hypothetical protein [Nannocystis radixulma]